MATPAPQKEPKLARARKIPEWEVYDAEVAALAKRLASHRTIELGLVSSDELAKIAAMDDPSEGASTAEGEAEGSPAGVASKPADGGRGAGRAEGEL